MTCTVELQTPDDQALFTFYIHVFLAQKINILLPTCYARTPLESMDGIVRAVVSKVSKIGL